MRTITLNGKIYELREAQFQRLVNTKSGVYMIVQCPGCYKSTVIHARTRTMCKLTHHCGVEFRPQWIEGTTIWARMPTPITQ